MEIFIKVESKDIFIRKLYDCLKRLTGDCRVKSSGAEICMLCRYFYILFIDEKEVDLSCIKEEYGAEVNLNVWINIYGKFYDEALHEVVKVINWITKEMDSDIVVLDDMTYLFFSIIQKKVYFDKSYDFPFGELEVLS